MTIDSALERLGRDLDARGHFTVALLLQVHPGEFMDLYPPPGEGLLTRWRRWVRRRFGASRRAAPGCHCCPVSGMTVDEAEHEFLLWLGSPSAPALTSGVTVSLAELHEVLAAAATSRGTYPVEAAVYWRVASPRRRALRLDWPVLGIGIDDSASTFGFLAGPGWNPAGLAS
jgi:hypothetical protein